MSRPHLSMLSMYDSSVLSIVEKDDCDPAYLQAWANLVRADRQQGEEYYDQELAKVLHRHKINLTGDPQVFDVEPRVMNTLGSMSAVELKGVGYRVLEVIYKSDVPHEKAIIAIPADARPRLFILRSTASKFAQDIQSILDRAERQAAQANLKEEQSV